MAISTANLEALAIEATSWSNLTPSHDYGPGSLADENKSVLMQTYYTANANCVEYVVLISVSYDRVNFNFIHWEDDHAMAQFRADTTARAGADFPGVMDGTVRATVSYNMSASCSPKVLNGKEKTVILATHGIGPA